MTTRQERAGELRASANAAEQQGRAEHAAELHVMAEWTLHPPPAQEAIPFIANQTGGQFFSDIEEQEQEWLWDGRLPLGDVVMLFGQQGAGKSTFAADLAARVSTGAMMPDESPGMKGKIILINPEDDPRATTIKRLKAAGADLSQVRNLSQIERSVPELDKPLKDDFCIPDDLDILEEEIRKLGKVKLIILDNVNRLVSDRVSTFRNASVQKKILGPLGKVAKRHGICILFIGHLIKGRGNTDIIGAAGGSKAFTDIPRVVLGLTINPNNSQQRILSNAKFNYLTPQAQPMTCKYENGQVIWLSGWNVTEMGRMEARKLSEARQNILRILEAEDGFLSSSDICQLLDIEYDTARSHLSRMAQAQQIAYDPKRGYCSLSFASRSFNSDKLQQAIGETVVLRQHPQTIAESTNGHTPIVA